MRSLALLISFFVVSSVCAESDWSKIDAAIQSGIDEQLYPGATLILGTDSEILYQKAYGHQTFAEDSAPTTIDSIFDMASVSKVEGTAAMSWLLLQEGKMHLDDHVTKYIPEFSQGDKESVTIRNLLTHTSGLKAYENYRLAEAKRTENETQADALILHYASLSKSYETGERCTYSCLNFQTMARVNENASGMRQEDFLIKNVYQPLGMMSTKYNMTEAELARVSPSHKHADGTDARQEIHDPLARYHGAKEHSPGNAGLYSTAPDLAIFCQMILNDGAGVYTPETIKEISKIQTPFNIEEKKGLGLDIYESSPYVTDQNYVPDHYVLGHSGYTGTLFLIDQNTEVFMVLLTNRTYPAQEGAVDQTPSVTPVRKAVWDQFLRMQPEYQEFYSTLDSQTAEASADAAKPS